MNQQWLLRSAHREIDRQLARVIAQLQQQSGSTFGDHNTGCSQAGLAGFGDKLVAHGKELVKLGELYKAGNLPPWVLDQQAAYGASAIGHLARRKRLKEDNDGKTESANGY